MPKASAMHATSDAGLRRCGRDRPVDAGVIDRTNASPPRSEH
jgi:hypothetical protein